MESHGGCVEADAGRAGEYCGGALERVNSDTFWLLFHVE